MEDPGACFWPLRFGKYIRTLLVFFAPVEEGVSSHIRAVCFLVFSPSREGCCGSDRGKLGFEAEAGRETEKKGLSGKGLLSASTSRSLNHCGEACLVCLDTSMLGLPRMAGQGAGQASMLALHNGVCDIFPSPDYSHRTCSSFLTDAHARTRTHTMSPF